MTSAIKGRLINALVVVASVLVLLSGVEVTIAFALGHAGSLASADGKVPRHLGKPLVVLRNYYMLMDRRIVQFLPECSTYDPELTYTFKPSARCTVANREYT